MVKKLKNTTTDDDQDATGTAPDQENDAENPVLAPPAGELVVDVYENDSHFTVLAAIAGVQIKDLDISVEKDMMVIKGHRQSPHEGEDRNFFAQECYWGPFSKKIVLPENVDVENADAAMDKGMLTVSIPKLAEEKKAKKNISVA